MPFSGQTQPKLDDKGRLILPAKWREALGGGVYLTKGQDHCVSIYTSAEFAKIADQLEAARQTTKAARFFIRNFMASAENESPDKQGRITIPGHLREYAGLSRDLILAGVNNHIEIWDLKTWNDHMAAQDLAFADLDEEVIPGIF